MTLPTTMPVVKAAAATVTDKTINLRLIQWVNDADDIADADNCDITINGTTLSTQLHIGSDVAQHDVVLWQIGPFNPGIHVTGLVVTTLDHGAIHVWYD